MASDKLRLAIAALTWLAAGAVFASAGTSARLWVGALVLLLVGCVVAWPLMKSPPPRSITIDVAHPDAAHLTLLQARLEHLPVAAWLHVGDQLQPLSSRARRLIAPGGICDRASFDRLLRAREHSGPIVLDTARGSERWQLQRQHVALDGEDQTLLVLVPLEQELESESLRAWQQLLQVLTHEIMNSLTPIKSLSETATSLLDEPAATEELRTALDAIARRAASLSSFVQTYRKVSHWPAPTLTPVDLQGLLARLLQAARPAWVKRGGDATFEVSSPTLRLLADEGQLEQAMLALIRNAEQATQDESEPRLWINAKQTRGGRLHITVRDNGSGVPPGMEQQIFLPFFSTREGGQGIGLTVVRQLVYGMGGRVRYVRPMEKGAAFVLIF